MSEEELYSAYCPKCKTTVKTRILEQTKNGKVKVECVECKHQWEAFT